MPFPVLQSAFDALYPPGDQNYWRADFVHVHRFGPDEVIFSWSTRIELCEPRLPGALCRASKSAHGGDIASVDIQPLIEVAGWSPAPKGAWCWTVDWIIGGTLGRPLPPCPSFSLFLLRSAAGAFHRLMQFVATSNPS
jgi:hypothetical protein